MSAQLLDRHDRRYLLAVQVGPVPARIEEEADGELVRREIRQSVAFAGSLVIRAITAQRLLDPPIPRSDRRPWVRTILPQCLREDGSSRRRTARERVSGWRISSGLPGLRLTGINDSDSFPPFPPFSRSQCADPGTLLFSALAHHTPSTWQNRSIPKNPRSLFQKACAINADIVGSCRAGETACSSSAKTPHFRST